MTFLARERESERDEAEAGRDGEIRIFVLYFILTRVDDRDVEIRIFVLRRVGELSSFFYVRRYYEYRKYDIYFIFARESSEQDSGHPTTFGWWIPNNPNILITTDHSSQ